MADKSDTLETQVSNAPTGEQLEKSATVDTVHNDQAVEVLYNYQGEQTWTPEEEKRLVRKIDLRLMCLLCVTFGLQYYDKAMLSQAVSTDRLSLYNEEKLNCHNAGHFSAHP